MAIPISQIREINKLLLAFSIGKYHKKGFISGSRNEFDSIISSLNMLGEELLATTVSRDYFSSIYNSVADMLFVLSPRGTIQNVNNSVRQILNYNAEFLLDKNISEIVAQKPGRFFVEIKEELKNKSSFTGESNFFTKKKKTIPVSCVCSKIFARDNVLYGYLLIAEDISMRKAEEQRILRTIIDTQEKERLRISKDLHDSMGFPLAGQKIYISSLKTQLKHLKGNLRKDLDSLDDFNTTAIASMRTACFDLMPSTLEKNGIDMALRELLKKLESQTILSFQYFCEKDFPVLDKPLEITIYRIIQEFINNTIKHAKARNVNVHISEEKQVVKLLIKDDGLGFYNKRIMKNGLNKNRTSPPDGHGLNNIATRVKAFNGTYHFTCKNNSGTSLEVFLPVK